ncbi:hypothetical protein RJT34_12569 [Clitoria ternatea]|uniref:Uncharacterized protein n=1 Tax=Clitoria ternatea TaxID=43366 RepID=A0AAN9PLH9_CLITE
MARVAHSLRKVQLYIVHPVDVVDVVFKLTGPESLGGDQGEPIEGDGVQVECDVDVGDGGDVAGVAKKGKKKKKIPRTVNPRTYKRGEGSSKGSGTRKTKWKVDSDSNSKSAKLCSGDIGSDGDKYPLFRMPELMKHYKWEKGTIFVIKQEFKKVVVAYAIPNRKDLNFEKMIMSILFNEN